MKLIVHYITTLLVFLLVNTCKTSPKDFKKFLAFLEVDPGLPQVIAAIPGTGDFNLPRNQKISVIFSKPMDINSCIQSFSVQPSVTGFFQTTDYSLEFIPTQEWDYGSYTYVITKSCEDKDGNDLKDLFSANFSIGNVSQAGQFPEVSSMTIGAGTTAECNAATASGKDFLNGQITDACMGNSTTNKITLTFSTAMNRLTTAAAVSVTPDQGFSYNWTSDTTLELTSDAALVNETRYTVSVSTAAIDQLDVNMQEPVVATFYVGTLNLLPSVSSVTVYNGTLTNCAAGSGTQTDIVTNSVTDACPGNPTNNPIQITFATAMDTSFTQAALSFSPTIDASYVWSSGNTLLTITPDNELSYGTRYTLDISTAARSANEVNLTSPFSASFTTGSSSAVSLLSTLTVPAGTTANCTAGTGTATDMIANTISNACTGNPSNSSIVFNFAYAMDTTATENAIGISPSIPGSFAWSSGNTVLTLTPDSYLSYSTRYTITLGTTAKTSTNVTATDATVASFLVGSNTEPTLVSTIQVNAGTIANCEAGTGANTDILTSTVTNGCVGNPTNNPITITFANAMNTAVTQAAVGVSPTTNATYAWSAGNTVLTITPDTYLTYGSRYTVTVGTSAETADGVTTSNPTEASFVVGATTEPTLVSTIEVASGTIANCAAGTGTNTDIIANTVTTGCVGNAGNNPIVITFPYAMSTAVTQAAISISPTINATYAWSTGNTVLTITPDSYLSYGTRYTVTVGTSAKTATEITTTNPTVASFVAGGTAAANLVSTITTYTGTLAACNGGTGALTDIIANTVTTACRGNAANNSLVFTFSTAMDTTPSQAAISISPSIDGSFAWTSGNTVLTLTSDTTLTYGQRYTVSFATSARSAQEISQGTALSYSFVVGATTTIPEIQAVGLVSQTNCTAATPTGSNTGADWNAGEPCFWDKSLAMLTPSSYQFRGGDTGGGSAGSATDCADVNTDNIRLIFSEFMNIGTTTAAISLSKLSPPFATLQLASYAWSECDTTFPFGCKVVDLVYAEQEASCNGTTFGDASTGGDFNLLRSDNTTAGSPIYQISVDTTAQDVNGAKFSSTFNFYMVGN
ncbi:MAG: Ig-like domain-containing protein [Spirochaetota bacterium]